MDHHLLLDFLRVLTRILFRRFITFILGHFQDLGILFLVAGRILILVLPINDSRNGVQPLLNLLHVQAPRDRMGRRLDNGQLRVAEMHIGRRLVAPVNWAKGRQIAQIEWIHIGVVGVASRGWREEGFWVKNDLHYCFCFILLESFLEFILINN